MSEEIQNKLIMIMKETLGEVEGISTIKPDDDLSSFGVNSVSFIKLVVAVEEEFGFEFDDEQLDFNNFRTINGIVEYIKGRC